VGKGKKKAKLVRKGIGRGGERERRKESIGGATPKFLGWPNPSLQISPSSPFTLFPLPFPYIPLEVVRLNRSMGLGAL